MTVTDLRSPEGPATREGDRRDHILAAAERAFVREGFHATTMQDVAAEAGMSPGNLYRYFRSKEAIVAGLCACDQASLAADFGTLATSGDIFGTLELMLRKQLVAEPRERFKLIVEIWAEATRNPEIAAMDADIRHHVHNGLVAVVEGAKRQGVAAADIDTDFAVRAISTVGMGLFKRRAHELDFDGEAELALAMAIIKAVLRGTVRAADSGGAA